MDRFFVFPAFGNSGSNGGAPPAGNGGGNGGGNPGNLGGNGGQQPQASSSQAAASPRSPKNLLQQLQNELLLNAQHPEVIPTLFNAFVMDLGEQVGFKSTKENISQLESALWLCLSGGLSSLQPQIENLAGTICGHVFSKSEIVYRCRTCGVDDTCVLCARCFNPSAHQGHDILFSVSGGSGCCDCGDPEAWRNPVQCPLHSPREGTTMQEDHSYHLHQMDEDLVASGSSTLSGTSQEVPEISQSARETIRAVVSFTVHQFRTFHSPRTWSTSALPPSLVLPQATPIPPSPSSSPSPVAASPIALATASGAPSLASSSSSSSSSSPTPPPTAAAPGKAFAVLLYNDETHSFDEVISQLTGSTSCSKEEALARAEAVDSVGREVVFTSFDLAQCVKVCQEIERTKLRCTIERLESVFLESLTPQLLTFCTSLAKQNIGYRRAICEELCQVWPSGIPETLDVFLQSDTGLWKTPRNALRDLIFSTLLMDSAKFKESLGARFIQHYSNLVEYYLKSDPEPDLSLVSISLQLFTTPSVVQYLANKCDLLSTIVGALKAFFAEAIPPSTHLINCEHSAFSNDRYSIVFYDLKYILTKPGIPAYITSNPRHLHGYLSFLELFQGMHPQERALTRHIEYDSNLWIKVFSLSMFITRTIPLFAACFPLSFDEPSNQRLSLEWAAMTTKEYIKQWQINHSAMLLGGASEQAVPTTTTTTLTTRFGEFPILSRELTSQGERAPSFHNVFHWFLTSLLRNGLQSPNASRLDLQNLFMPHPQDLSIMWILEGPLRVFVALAQVSAGLWRRNGLSMVNQAYQYKGFLMRDQTYNLDLLIMQTAAVVLSPDHIISLILDRFSMAGWFSSRPVAPFDETQNSLMAEEFLTFIIALVNERWMTGYVSQEDKLKTYFIQLLCAGPHLHSDLTKKMESEMSELPFFDDVLALVSTKRLAPGAEHETFVLRDEFYKLFDPYFFHTRRSDKEKAEEIIRERRKKTKAAEPFFPPILVPLKEPYRGLEALLHSKTLCQIIFYGIWLNSPGFGPQADEMEADASSTPRYPQNSSVLDMCLYLMTLALAHIAHNNSNGRPVPYEGSFVANATELTFETLEGVSQSLVDLLLVVRKHPKFPPEEEQRMDWCLATLGSFGNGVTKEKLSEFVSARPNLDEDGLSEAERKKKLAKERQEKIMREFATKQQNFVLKNYNFADEDLEENEAEMEPAEFVEASFETDPCILCRTPTDVTTDRPFGILGFIQPSSLTGNVHDPSTLLHPTITSPSTSYVGLDQELNPPEGFCTYQSLNQPSTPRFSGCHVSTCGHFMHNDCYEKFEKMYLQSIPNRRPFFLCPLCKNLGDVLIPVVSTRLRNLDRASSDSPTGSFSAASPSSSSSSLPLPTPSLLFTSSASSSQPAQFDDFLKELANVFQVEQEAKIQSEATERERSNSGLFSSITSFLSKLKSPSPPVHIPPAPPLPRESFFLSSSPSQSLLAQRADEGMEPDQMDFEFDESNGRKSPSSVRSQSPTPAAISPAQTAAVAKIAKKLDALFHHPSKSTVQSFLNFLDSYTYTLKCLELSTRGKPSNGCFLESLGKSDRLFLSTFSNLIEAISLISDKNKSLYKDLAWNIVKRTLWGLSSEVGMQEAYNGIMISKTAVPLEDTITNLLRIFAISPPATLEQARHFIRLFYMVEIMKVSLGMLISLVVPVSDGSATSNSDEEAFVSELLHFVKLNALRIDPKTDGLNPRIALKELQTSLLPFLRQASTILNVHFNVPWDPKALNLNGEVTSEFQKLSAYLNLPQNLRQVINLKDASHSKLLSGWCFMWHNSEHAPPQTLSAVENIAYSPLIPKVLPIWLAPLQTQYDSLLVQSCKSQCPKTGALRSDPAFCLICGKRYCCQSGCCAVERRGPCTVHSENYHGSLGLFLLDKQCVLLVLQEGKGAFHNAPYFDSHGEADPGLRRGKPLTLNKKRYDHLRDLWVTHKMHTLISQKLDRGHHVENAWEIL